MGNNLNETIQVIRQTLLSVSDITDLVSDRILTSHIIDFENITTKFPVIIIENKGGSANYGMAKQSISCDVYTYSKISSTEANSIYDLIYNNLHAARLHTEGLSVSGYARETSRPIHGYNHDVKGWFCRGTFDIYTGG